MLNAQNSPTAANDDRMHAHAPTPEQRDLARARAVLVVPIRSIGSSQRDRIAEHLIALGEHDRYLRFGYAASDEQIRRYVAQLDFERDEIYGIFNRKLELIAMAHLAFAVAPDCESCAEFGVSVAEHARSRGFGTRLFERAAMHARNEGVKLLFIHALTENQAMLKIARRAGAAVERTGAESDAWLHLAPPSMDSRLAEAVQFSFGEADYRLKQQAKRFHDLIREARGSRGRERANPK